MNREIKFRGKNIIDDEWIYGNLVKVEADFINSHTGFMYFIIPFTTNGSWRKTDLTLKFLSPCFEVIPETVGQYTGLKDKNGKEIYEGDIVFAEARFDCANMVVVWDKGSFVLVPCEKYKNYISGCGYKDIRWLTKTVIGNIYEDKDLLEVDNEKNS